MIDLGYLYLVPLAFGLLAIVVRMLLSQNVKRTRPFDNDYTNLAYNLSFIAPFVWFVEEDERHEKAVAINRLIEDADMKRTINYRSFTTLQMLLFLTGTVIFLIVNIGLIPLINILAYGFNLNPEALTGDGTSLLLVRSLVFSVCVLPSLLMKLVMKRRISSREVAFLKDLPLLQLFIILMLRSNATINDVLFTLSTTDTAYRDMFAQAYRIYLREPSEAFDFLEDVFYHTKIIETVYMLRGFNQYAKEESILTLENNQSEILEHTEAARKKAEAGKNVFAQISMSFPFIAVLMLGGGPLVYYALQLFTSAGI